MAWALLPAGSFRMGSPADQGKADERPQHRVDLSRSFHMTTTPITVGQFRRFVEASGYRTTAELGTGAWVWNGVNDWVQKGTANWRNPGFPQTDDHPVVCVSWNDAQAYCAWLGKQSGRVCRLPTEAEFEYAQRAGTSTPWYFGTDPKGFEAFGWPQGLTPQGFPSHPVGQKRPNPWGLHDMVGNVWQWCADWYSEQSYGTAPTLNPRGPAMGGARVNRGGMGDNPESWRSAARDSLPPDSNYSNQGFRVVREVARNTPDGRMKK
jgi:formylglycine-generating enzyme required for sulfatase activity